MDRYLFLGGGHLSGALITGLLASGCLAEQISVLERHAERRQFLSEQFGIVVSDSLSDVIQGATVCVLAVRPNDALTLLGQFDIHLNQPVCLVSCVAGLSCAAIRTALPQNKLPILRAMPNLPAVLQAGMAGLYCEPGTALVHRQAAERLLRAVGTVLWVEDEALMHAITAVSGSGPGYIFRLMQAMSLAAEKQGLTPEQARISTVNTVFGAAKMALESPQSFADLCEKVCVPGGTTEQGVAKMQSLEIDEIFVKIIASARQRSEQLMLTGLDRKK